MSSHLLLISDSAAAAAAVSEALQADGDGLYEVEWVPRCADGLERLAKDRSSGDTRTQPIAAIFVDLGQPGSPGPDTFEQFVRAAPNIPILVLGSDSDEQSARDTLLRGAQDYLLKERLDSYTLLKALDSAVKRSAISTALFEEKEGAQIMLNSMGDAVISTDLQCRVIYLNAVAEQLTGWSMTEAVGRRLEEVFQPLDAATRAVSPNSMALAIDSNATFNLAPDSMLIRRDGHALAVEDSAAPVHDRTGRVTGAVMIFRDVSAARVATQRLAHLAEHDGLTGLANRARFNDRLDQALALAKRHGQHVAVLYLDVDQFKPINDSLGHDIGDKLLQAIARRLIQCVRSSDSVGRQGGDEFLILLSEVAQAKDAKVIAGKIIHSLSVPYEINQHRLNITTSVGIAIYPDDGVNAASLVTQADFAMYCAKSGGGNRYHYFNPALNADVAHHHTLAIQPPAGTRFMPNF